MYIEPGKERSINQLRGNFGRQEVAFLIKNTKNKSNIN